MVLAAGGGVLGTILAAWTETWMQSISPFKLPFWLDLFLDGFALAYIAAVTVLVGVLIGLLPALQETGHHLFMTLRKSGSLEQSGGVWWHRGLVVTEYSAAVVILILGLLMVKNFHNLSTAERGYEAESVLTLKLPLTGQAYDEPVSRADYLEDVRQRPAHRSRLARSRPRC